MHPRAVLVQNDSVPLVRLQQPVEVLGNPQLRDAWAEETAGVYVPELMWKLVGAPPGRILRGVRDDNRSAIFPEWRVVLRDREYFACVKGCGTATDAYENVPLSADRLRAICHDADYMERLSSADGVAPGFITGERWFGGVPYGGQAPDNAAIGLLTSLRADLNEIAGFFLCPVVALVRLPEEFARVASQFYWYRKYDGSYWQEVRLMPSNVRLYFHSPVTFGVDTARAFALFDLTSYEGCERFLEKLARSSVAALTLFARSLRYDERAGRYLGLGYHDVWLDKDAVIAPDGTLHFADLEGIEDVQAATPADVREAILGQFHRNVYEATYALEAMAAETQRRWGVEKGLRERRRWTVEILARACAVDPYVRIEPSEGRVLMAVEPRLDPDECGVEIEFASEVL